MQDSKTLKIFLNPNGNSPENDIVVKQKSIPPFLGIVGDKKWSPFLDLGIPSPIFLHPKSLKMAVFGCKKKGLGIPKSKNGDHFLSPTIPKNGGIDFCSTRISFSGGFGANLENHVF